jgi:hypothetical protein
MLGNLNLPERMQVDQQLRIFPAAEDGKDKTTGALSDQSPDSKDQKTLHAEDFRAADPVRFDQQVRYRRPGAYRSDIDTPDLQHIHISAGGSAVTVLDGSVTEGALEWQACYKDLFVFSSRRSLVHHLERLGVDMNTSSLGRLNKELVYVAGARYPDETRAQVWIEKTFFRPVRWIVVPAKQPGDPPACEIRYLDWQRIDRSWYPARIEFYESGRQVRAMIVEGRDTNPVMPESLFNISAVRRKYEPAEADPAGSGGTTEEIRRQIEEFNQLYESPTQ